MLPAEAGHAGPQALVGQGGLMLVRGGPGSEGHGGKGVLPQAEHGSQPKSDQSRKFLKF